MTVAGEYLKPSEIAASLRCSTRTVARAISSGALPAIEFGPRIRRVSAEDLAEFIGKSAGGAGQKEPCGQGAPA